MDASVPNDLQRRSRQGGMTEDYGGGRAARAQKPWRLNDDSRSHPSAGSGNLGGGREISGIHAERDRCRGPPEFKLPEEEWRKLMVARRRSPGRCWADCELLGAGNKLGPWSPLWRRPLWCVPRSIARWLVAASSLFSFIRLGACQGLSGTECPPLHSCPELRHRRRQPPFQRSGATPAIERFQA